VDKSFKRLLIGAFLLHAIVKVSQENGGINVNLAY
jgi:hypothetical protein